MKVHYSNEDGEIICNMGKRYLSEKTTDWEKVTCSFCLKKKVLKTPSREKIENRFCTSNKETYKRYIAVRKGH